MRRVLCAGAHMQDRKNFREGVEASQSHSTCVVQRSLVRCSSNCLVWEVEMAKDAFVPGVCVLASASQPGGDSRLSVAEDTFSRGRVQPFGKRVIRTTATRHEKGFSGGTRACRAGH